MASVSMKGALTSDLVPSPSRVGALYSRLVLVAPEWRADARHRRCTSCKSILYPDVGRRRRRQSDSPTDHDKTPRWKMRGGHGPSSP